MIKNQTINFDVSWNAKNKTTMKTKFLAGLVATGIAFGFVLIVVYLQMNVYKDMTKGLAYGIIILSWLISYYLLKPKDQDKGDKTE